MKLEKRRVVIENILCYPFIWLCFTYAGTKSVEISYIHKIRSIKKIVLELTKTADDVLDKKWIVLIQLKLTT